MARSRVLLIAAALGLLAMLASGQPVAATSQSDAQLRLGADDVIQIKALEAEELSDKPIKIGGDGFINLPIVGRIKAAGLTVEELQSELAMRLRRMIVNPDVTVSAIETHSHPVSVVGAVKSPGVFQLQGRKTLLEILSLAGGPNDAAGYTARITRQKEFGLIPLPNAIADFSGQFSVAELNLQNIMNALDPAGNLVIMPNDVISVPKADMVYVIGDVVRAGSIILGDQKTVTVLQAIAVVSGLGKTAKATQAKILRVNPGSSRRIELAVNLKNMLAGKINDIPMQADDILFVPTSMAKDIGLKTLGALGGGATTMIYRLP